MVRALQNPFKPRGGVLDFSDRQLESGTAHKEREIDIVRVRDRQRNTDWRKMKDKQEKLHTKKGEG